MEASNNLQEFLLASRQSRARESLLNHKLFYDLKLAAACANYHLETYYSDVDSEGFDIVLDDQDHLRKMQIKTVLSTSATRLWEIRKAFLRPNIWFMDKLGFSESQEGLQGGVILMEIAPTGKRLEIKYYYTDIFILLAFYLKIIQRRNASSQNYVRALFDEFRKRTRLYETIKIRKSAFVETKSASHLLGLMGFHSIDSNWNTGSLLGIANQVLRLSPRINHSPNQVENLKKYVAETISEHVDDDLVLFS